MKKIYNIILFAALICLSLASCHKLDNFLDKAPSSDKSYVSTISDCDLLLNNPQLIGGFDHTYFLDDCIGFSDFASLYSEGSAEYNEFCYWSDTKYIVSSSEDDPCWSGLYSNIYYTNIVINYIDKVSGDDETLRSQLKGEAYMGRAYYHFMAVNTYAKEYNPRTATSDAGVPYVKDTDTQGKRTRATVQEVYDNIILDMEDALANLKTSKPESGKNQRGNLAAANALLAKVYLHMQNWDKTAEYAKKSLDIYNSLIDYNEYNSYSAYSESINYTSLKNIENTYLKGAIQSFTSAFVSLSIQFGAFMGGLYITPELTNCLDQINDLRFKLFMGADFFTGNVTIAEVRTYDPLFYGYTNCGCNTAETYLILAEAYARSGKLSEACNILNTFLRTRYDKSSFTAFSSADKTAVIEKITNEKKIEFVYTGNRWFEMRRLNILGEYDKTINRYNASGNIIGTIKASPARMVLPIPQKITNINPDITQNPFE